MLSNTLRLNFCYMKIIHILHPRYPKIIGHILKYKQKSNCVYFHEIIQLIIMKMKIKIINRSHRYDINRPRSRHGHRYSKYKKCLSKMMLICIEQYLSKFEPQFMKKLSNTEAEFEKRVLYKKSVHRFHKILSLKSNLIIGYSLDLQQILLDAC